MHDCVYEASLRFGTLVTVHDVCALFSFPLVYLDGQYPGHPIVCRPGEGSPEEHTQLCPLEWNAALTECLVAPFRVDERGCLHVPERINTLYSDKAIAKQLK